MPINSDFKKLLLALNNAGARSLVVGGHAVVFYTALHWSDDLETLFSQDLDVWIDPTPENAPRVYAALQELEAPTDRLTIEDLHTKGKVFEHGLEAERIDLLTVVDGLSFAEAWDEKLLSSYDGVPVYLLGLEQLVWNKLRAHRPQDLIDVELLEGVRRRVAKRQPRTPGPES